MWGQKKTCKDLKLELIDYSCEQIQKTKDIEASDVEYIALIKNKTDDSVLI